VNLIGFTGKNGEHTMDDKRSRYGILIGLSAAACAFGAAATLSATTAPTARADDFSDIIGGVEADFGYSQAALTTASADFASNHITGGAASLVDSADYSSLSAPDDLLIGTVEALTNETITVPEVPWSFTPVTSFAEGLTFFQEDVATGQDYFSDAATAFSSGDYGQAVAYDLIGADYSTIVALQEVLLGSVASF
jgi:hypothetical protein